MLFKLQLAKGRVDLEKMLEDLERLGVISWETERQRVRLNYDLKDERRFIWLGPEGPTTSPFEPRLENDKIYNAKDFRTSVIEAWLRKGHAHLI